MLLRYTKHGTSRAGDDYQDLWGAEILIEFLEHPERYQWVRFEADEAGFLDDILALRTDGSYLARQIKFTVDPESTEREASWHYLLERKKGKRGPLPSLLQKWASSLTMLKEKGKVFTAALYTNRQPAAEIQTLLSQNGTGRLNFDAISDADVLKEICGQLGGVEVAREFFSEFCFFVDKPEPHTLEEGLRKRFFNLGGDDHGWLNLISEIRSWAKFKDYPPPDGRITIQILRHAANWHQLRELPQGFEVPSDYVLPSNQFHKDLVKALRKRTWPCLALWGSPGTGKSTYLSYLVDCLQKKGIPIVRHHYFLSLADRSGDRFDHRIVAESIMQQIEARYSEAVGSLATRNPNPNELGKWLEVCGRHFADRKLPFIVVVDGLDHVWRERRSVEQLNLLFERLLPVPEGVVVIVGTQKVAKKHLPQRLLTYASQDEWWQLPSVPINAIKKWLEFRSDLLDLPADSRGRNYVLNNLARAFYRISEGHPLHLRYSFEALIKQGCRIWEQTILALPPCPEGDIEGYYQRLWDSLQEEGKQMLHLLAACDFSWPREGLVNCLSAGPVSDAAVMKAESQIAHLLRWNEIGATAFHGSLLVFVKRQPDHNAYAQRLRPKVLDWLVKRAPEYWRWAYEWIVRADMGDPSALRDNPNQSWTIEALAVGRPIERIIDILERASWLALDNGDLARVIELNTLWEYVSNSSQFEEDTYERLLYSQLRLNEDEYLYPRMLADLTKLSDEELVVVGEAARQRGTTKLPQQCLDEFRRRVEEAYRGGEGRDRRPEVDVARNLDLAVLTGTIDPKRILRFIGENRSHGIGREAFSFYSRRLAALRDIETLRDLFRCKLDENDAYDLVTAGVRVACEEGIDLNQWIGTPSFLRIPLLLCYRVLRSNPPPSNLFIETPDIRHLDQREYELFSSRPDLVRFFHAVFFSSLALALCADGDYSDLWLHRVSRHTWANQFCCYLAELGGEYGKRLRSGEIPCYSWVYQVFRSFPPPDLDADRVTRRLYTYTTHALIEIALDLHLLGLPSGGPVQLSDGDFQEVIASSYWNREIWLERYVEDRRRLLTDEALGCLFSREQAHFAQTINELNERAVSYAHLAQIAVLHGRDFSDKAKGFLRKVASCLIGYRNHKDVLLFETLEIVEACHKESLAQTDQWLFDLSPMINAINDFTDGDETNHLPIEFARTVLTVRPELFPSYYQHLVVKEEWKNAEGAMRTFLANADLTDRVVQAVARTVVDTGGLDELKKRSDSGDPSAVASFKAQEQLLGGIDLEEETSSGGSTVQPEGRSEPPNFKDYPPERLQDYINALYGAGLDYRSELMTEWFEHWYSAGHGEGVLEGIEKVASSERNQVMVDHLFDRVFDLCLSLRGRSAAYPWLVRAHRARYGWSKFYSYEDEATMRFKRVAESYADKWLDFVRDNAIPRYGHGRIGHIPGVGFCRLVKFCLIVGQRETAAKVAEAAVRVTLERKADLALPTPKWVLENVGK